ncbi:TetR/AcrR family transcriptional regulator [Micromonospora marina]|uniref:TetR/AcrR family transcriptional regulator n=1 Tax=Micromonospora marina TaxID=307120 RepID=UPI000380B446|nr:TetR/AcrR family transcriptional regulator C-terminal domain-containing protein [Micromonospora marina]
MTRDAIVGKALDIAHREGLGAVTMRAVAGSLGVTAMALYRHVTDHEQLVRLVADRIGGLVRPRSAADASWEQRARAWAQTQRETLRQYPGVAAWLINNGPAGPEAYRLLDNLLETLHDAGFDDATAISGAATIMSWTFTRVAIEDSADDRVRRRSPVRTAAFLDGLSGVDAAVHPFATGMGPTFFTLPPPEIFDTGLDWILTGFGQSLN